MKKLNYSIFILLLLTSVLVQGQDRPDIPTPPPPPPFPNFKLSPEEEQKYLENIDSDLLSKLQEIKEVDEAKYARLLRNLYWKSINWPIFANGRDKEKMETEKKIIEYEILTESLSIEYKKAPPEEKEKRKKELQNNLSQLFDLKERQKEKEVIILETELRKLKEKIAARKKNKDIIIKRRMEELLGDGEYLEWE